MKKISRYYHNSPVAFIGAAVILLFVVLSILAPVITPYEYDAIDLPHRLMGASPQHILGTDELGRDVYTRIIYGSRVSVFVGIFSTVLSTLVGIVLGVIAGYCGRVAENVIMRLTDVALAFPSLLLIMAIMFTLGPGILNMFVAIALVNWAGASRIIYAQTLKIKESAYVESAKLSGMSGLGIVFRHIILNCSSSIIAIMTMDIPAAILEESTLSFIGFGIAKPIASWGTMVNTGRQFLFTDPMLCILPCIAITILVLAFNLLGRNIDKLRGYKYE